MDKTAVMGGQNQCCGPMPSRITCTNSTAAGSVPAVYGPDGRAGIGVIWTGQMERMIKRRHFFSLLLSAGLLILFVQTAISGMYEAIQQKPVNYRQPPREYRVFSTNGWTIEVEKQLLTDNQRIADKAVSRLARKLNEVVEMLPAASRKRIVNRRIFLMYGPKAKNDGRDNGAEYFQPHAAAHFKDIDLRWGGNVAVYCAENYARLSELWSTKVLVHELAHAYHLEQWPEDQPDICRAYKDAMDHKLYHNIKDRKGKTHETVYAVQNPLEYFAELSCMYFGGCDYPPYNRKELKAYDPEGYAMIQKMWNVKD